MPQEQVVNLNPRSVVAPLMQCLHETMDVTSIALKALDAAEFPEAMQVSGSKMEWKFHGGLRSADDKKIAYENWQLSKGLQELARAVRECLESTSIAALSNTSKRKETNLGGVISATL